MDARRRSGPSLLGPPSPAEQSVVGRALRTETTGGLLVLLAALVAIVWANSPWAGAYTAVHDFVFGVSALGLRLSIAEWTSEGLLTLFFLVAGIELKRELVVGELRTRATAAAPVIAAFCGMAVPAALYLTVTLSGGGDLSGWAVPMATDIAFALAVLAVISTHLPPALRAFLLTLAVVDDLGAILVIALFFTDALDVLALGGAVLGLGVFHLLQRLRVRDWWFYVGVGLVVWTLTHASGVHATVAGLAMGLLLRTLPDEGGPGRRGEAAAPAQWAAHRLRPLSAGVAAPLFALFAAGVSVAPDDLRALVAEPEPLGIVLGLVVGKIVGIFGGTYVAARFTRLRLSRDLAWADVFGLAVLAGIGFTVSLLIAELAFTDPAAVARAKAAVLTASLIAALTATVVLTVRDRRYRTARRSADGPP